MKAISLTSIEMNALREHGEVTLVIRINDSQQVVKIVTLDEPISCFIRMKHGRFQGQLIAKSLPPEDGRPEEVVYVYETHGRDIRLQESLDAPSSNTGIQQDQESDIES